MCRNINKHFKTLPICKYIHSQSHIFLLFFTHMCNTRIKHMFLCTHTAVLQLTTDVLCQYGVIRRPHSDVVKFNFGWRHHQKWLIFIVQQWIIWCFLLKLIVILIFFVSISFHKWWFIILFSQHSIIHVYVCKHSNFLIHSRNFFLFLLLIRRNLMILFFNHTYQLKRLLLFNLSVLYKSLDFGQSIEKCDSLSFFRLFCTFIKTF